MLHHDPAATKSRLFDALRRIAATPAEETVGEVAAAFAPDVAFHASHPFNALLGAQSVAADFWGPIKRSFAHLRRSDDLFTGGSFAGADWISATGHLYGVFREDFLGIPATGGWAALRFGEFHKVEGGRITRTHLILDLPDLMRQAGVAPWRPGLGVETLTPGPASRDGVVLSASDAAESEKSLLLVEAMIFDGLVADYDGAHSSADAMRRYWTEDMMWYGPALIGATMGIDGFYRFHETPWEQAMLPRGPKPEKATKHVTRFGDGPFCSFTGWPSIYATHGGDFLGLPATGKPVEIRVMDFYHRRGEKLDENWIFIDMPHLFLQLGVDLFERMRAAGGGR